MSLVRWLLLVWPWILLAGSPEPQIRVLHDDGGWCWFEDERAVFRGGQLVFGVVAAGTRDPARRGNIEVVTYDLASGRRQVATLHRAEGNRRWFDDHNSPALLVRPDHRVLAMYALHGVDNRIYYRISAPEDTTQWGPEQVFIPSATSRVTYSNLHFLSNEDHVYDFFRGLDNSYKPSYAYSDDLGNTWKTGNVLIHVPLQFKHRPYVKYASNGRDTVHIAYTEGHPRDYDNSIYHIIYREGELRRSDGAVIRSIKEGLRAPEEGTRVFQGGPNRVAWISDLHLDPKGNPVLVFSEQREPSGLDLRYHYARWDGKKWVEHEIAYAGTRLYKGEDDYTGNIALDPQDLSTVYISSNADPVSGKPMPHWELYRGVTADGGAHWKWSPVTHDSAADNIRPIVPVSDVHHVVMWLRGKMTAYTDYRFEVVGIVR